MAMLLPGNKDAVETSLGGAHGASPHAGGASGSFHHAGSASAGNPASRDSRRFIVRGLAWETSTETLRSTFERYGEIEEGAVVEDKVRGDLPPPPPRAHI